MNRTISCRTSMVISLLTFLLALVLVSLPLPAIHGQEKKNADPWANSETMQPAQLAKTLTDKYVSVRSEEHTSELQSQSNLVCRLLLEKKKIYMRSQILKHVQ